MKKIALSLPTVGDLEHQYVLDALGSDRLAFGPFLDRFEAAMATLCGTRHAVAVSSGTSALHLIVEGLGLGPGDEVLTTPFSFVASSNALLFVDAVPRFVDIDPVTYNVSAEAYAAALTPRTKAILAVDVFGLPMDWTGLTALAEQHGLLLIDDACEALGAVHQGRPVGSWGAAAAFGFYPNKQITTGEGGCITTDSDELAAFCRSARNQGRATAARMEHVRLGYNYRMPELSAALGCAQLAQRAARERRRADAVAWYREALAPLADQLVLPPEAPAGDARTWFVFVVRLRDEAPPAQRDQVLAGLQAAGVGCAPYFPTIHLQPYYRGRFGYQPGDFPVCEAVAARTLALPLHPRLTQADVAYVAETLHHLLRP